MQGPRPRGGMLSIGESDFDYQSIILNCKHMESLKERVSGEKGRE